MQNNGIASAPPVSGITERRAESLESAPHDASIGDPILTAYTKEMGELAARLNDLREKWRKRYQELHGFSEDGDHEEIKRTWRTP